MPVYCLPEVNHREGQKYIIYGTGEAARQYHNQLLQRYGTLSVEAFLETRPEKTEFLGKPVICPEQIEKSSVKDYKYIVTSFASMDFMIEKLISIGVDKEKIIRAVEPIANKVLANNAGYFGSICFYPEVASEDKLKDLFERISWYVPATDDNKARITISTGIFSHEAPANIEIVDKEHIQQEVRASDIVMVWDRNSLSDPLIIENKSKVYCVDENFFSTIECENYRRLYYHCIKNDVLLRGTAISKSNFSEMRRKNDKKKDAYVFGTGPSIDQAYYFDYSGAFNIICNSMVKDQRLLNHIKPDLLVFADPVFHFSPCEYSRRFREDALKVVKEFGCYVLIPDFTVPLMLAHYPELSDRLIGMPMLQEFNFPDEERFFVRASYNILTMFMLPVASSLAEHIHILGCDGRQKSETYFWNHNQNTQYTDLMKTVFDMHPSFFRDRVYEDYYEEHCGFLAGLIEFGEARGKKYHSVTPSFIPALSSRMGLPKVSVIMPAYNAGKYIDSAIQSVQAQSYRNWELVIVEDGSSDDTIDIIRKYSDEDKRIRLLQNNGKGVSAARNKGLMNARGKYISFLDADDTMQPDSLKLRVEALDSDTGLRGVYCKTQMVDENLNELDCTMGCMDYINFNDMSRNPVHLNSIMVRADLLQSVSFDTQLTNGEDWLFLSDILRSGAELKRVEGCVVNYRIHSESTVNKDFLTHENCLAKVINYIYGSRTGLAHVAPEFAKGLKYPPKDEVLMKRRISLLARLLMEKQAGAVADVLDEIKRYDYELLSEREIRQEINTSIYRYFLYNENAVQEFFKIQKESIIHLTQECELEKYFPAFSRLFEGMLEDYVQYGYRATKLGFTGVLPGGKYILYGTGSMSSEITRYMEYIGSTILYYTDSDEKKWGNTFKGKNIISPREIAEYSKDIDKIIIASSFTDEILSILFSLGYSREKDIIVPR